MTPYKLRWCNASCYATCTRSQDWSVFCSLSSVFSLRCEGKCSRTANLSRGYSSALATLNTNDCRTHVLKITLWDVKVRLADSRRAEAPPVGAETPTDRASRAWKASCDARFNRIFVLQILILTLGGCKQWAWTSLNTFLCVKCVITSTVHIHTLFIMTYSKHVMH